jgi:hypothetical protein
MRGRYLRGFKIDPLFLFCRIKGDHFFLLIDRRIAKVVRRHPTPRNASTPNLHPLLMPNIDLDVVKLSYDVKFPTIDFDVDIDVPKEVPEVGGKSWRLKSFSLNVADPKITIPVDAKFFDGSVSVELNFERCEINISGEVSLDVGVKKFRWHIGPEHCEYVKPLSLKEPSWSVHPQVLDSAKVQTQVNNALPRTKPAPPSIRKDLEAKAKLVELLIFHGAVHLIEILTKAAADFAKDMMRNAEGEVEGKPSDSPGTILLAVGGSASIGFGAGAAGARGFYVTSGADFGVFGTTGFDVGFIAELSAGLCFLVYWSDEHQTAEDCFRGNNLFVTVDCGEGVSVSVTLSWPEPADAESIVPENPTTANPCGVAFSLGPGVGSPLNFAIGNSRTWADLTLPPGVQVTTPGQK